MTQNVRDLAERARLLADNEKLQLLDELLNQLNIPDPATLAVWEEEVSRRIKADAEGKLETHSYEVVMRKYRPS